MYLCDSKQEQYPMKIDRIDIVNFKGFKRKSVEFHSQVTVIIGNNTAGKTSLIKALQVGMGEYLQCLKTLPGGQAYRRNFCSLDRHKEFDAKLRDYRTDAERTRISINGRYVQSCTMNGNEWVLQYVPVTWSREYTGTTTSHSRANAGELMDAVSEMERLRENGNAAVVYPLLLSFGAKRTNDAQAASHRKTKERELRVEKAYKYALHDKVDFEGAMEWLRRFDKNIKDGKEFDGTREAFFEALGTAIPALSEIDFDNGEIEAVVSVSGHTPERHHFSYMSDGLQSMINIVAEIAHRCIELNGCFGKNAVRVTSGVVLIDEIDLYLHPHWQKHVLDDLAKAFPNLQFVVSTHSPFIVQSLQKQQLVSFDNDVTVDGEPYREGLEDIASERMGMKNQIRSRRFEEMMNLAGDYYQAVTEGRDEKEILDKLRRCESEFSDNPAYVALIRNEYKKK